MRVVVLWTGGKDSVLALQSVLDEGHQVSRLITFAPENPDFKAHPIDIMKAQANSIGLLHQIITITGDFREGYEQALQSLKDEGIDAVVTGDIDLIKGAPNWINECAIKSGITVLKPLWQQDRIQLMSKLLTLGYELIISAAVKDIIPKEWLGQPVDEKRLKEIVQLSDSNSMDICGENGEYHTIVYDGPLFKSKLDVMLGNPYEYNGLMVSKVSFQGNH
ncbi:MAG: diphthine--ammonia ligase [Coxiellaceae bacterium]|nr:diphthine--ammonia ligase [Coxiellaceae bacterium]